MYLMLRQPPRRPCTPPTVPQSRDPALGRRHPGSTVATSSRTAPCPAGQSHRARCSTALAIGADWRWPGSGYFLAASSPAANQWAPALAPRGACGVQWGRHLVQTQPRPAGWARDPGCFPTQGGSTGLAGLALLLGALLCLMSGPQPQAAAGAPHPGVLLTP